MSLQGSYGPREEPYVKGWLTIPRLGFLSSQITFLVDTGADHTTLMPADGVYAGLDYSALGESVTTLGIGGLTHLFSERGIVIFEDSGVGLQCYEIDLRIVKPSPDLLSAPSLLGRDILSRWRMIYSPSDGPLLFEVLGSDQTIPHP